MAALTYEGMYDLLRREKTRPELQKLDKTFLHDVRDFLKEKQIPHNNSSIFSQKDSEISLKQVENTKKLLKELYEKRETKILSLALSSSKNKSKYDTSSLLDEELKLYEAIKASLDYSRSNILESITIGTKNPQDRLKQVKFLNPTPQFLGLGSESYGPFDQDYIASLPEELASVLIKNKRAEEI